jgi:hypothetical protein
VCFIDTWKVLIGLRRLKIFRQGAKEQRSKRLTMMSCVAVSRLTLRRCRVASTLSTRLLNNSSFLLQSEQEPAFDGVSSDISKLIYHHAHQPQTAVSLQALMRTGRGEFLHKTYKEAITEKNIDGKGATEQVLMQVCQIFVVLFHGLAGRRQVLSGRIRA